MSATGASIDVGAPRSAAVDRMEARMESPGREKQILVAGVGNAFLADDGFGGAVAKGLEGRELPSGVTVMDFGTGGLDLAYEVMRGYDALVIVDVSRQGGRAGNALRDRAAKSPRSRAAIEDGEVINPHGMDPKTVLRFVKSVGGWPGKVVIVACEPTAVEDDGDGAERRGRRERSSARSTPCSSRSRCCSRTRPTEG